MPKPITEIFENIRNLRWTDLKGEKPDWRLLCGGTLSADFNSVTEAISFLARLNLSLALEPRPSYYIHHGKYFDFTQRTNDPSLYIHITPYGGDDILEKTSYPYETMHRPCVLSLPAQRIDSAKLRQTLDAERACDREAASFPALEKAG